MGTITTFDLDRFTRAAEERDAATQLSMYGPDAVVTINNKVSRAPRGGCAGARRSGRGSRTCTAAT
jgi:hypothetical protein